MIIVKDDFLPRREFDGINTHILSRFKPGQRYDNEMFILPSLDHCAVRIREVSDDGTLDGPACRLGLPIISITEAMREYLITELKLIDPLPLHFWFQYQSMNQGVGPHFDGTVRDRTLEQSISTLLYTHSEWEDDWGGELCVHNVEVLPKPNRLIMYTRDEEHWVNPIKHRDPDYQRMFFGVSWSFYGFN